MKNFIQPGETVTVDAPADVSSGNGVLVGVLFGVAVHDADSGDPVEITTCGVFELAKTSAQEWSAGDAIYWDPSENEATTSDGANNAFIGAALQDADNPSDTGVVRLNGASPAAVESA